MTKISVIVAKYMELRRRKEEIKDKYESDMEPINKSLNAIESYFLKYFNDTGQTQIKTPDATVFSKTNDYAQVADWDALLDFIRDNEVYEFLEKRVSKKAVTDYVEANKAVPPGVNYGTKLTINVRKA